MSNSRNEIELFEWVKNIEAGIRTTSRTYTEYPSRYEEMVTDGMLSSSTIEERIRFHLLKDGHPDFEHFLRTVKYNLAFEKFKVISSIHPSNPRYLRSLNIIEPLERLIQNRLASHRYAFCPHHQNYDGEEVHLFIMETQSGQLQPHRSKFARIQQRRIEEEEHRVYHRERVSELQRDLGRLKNTCYHIELVILVSLLEIRCFNNPNSWRGFLSRCCYRLIMESNAFIKCGVRKVTVKAQ
ncbi:hypothetical protein BDA99DRAFT_539016 [Phascolomyces articulosus]|uniref:Uncharacterized protein n=1 Tax=Phascolomyces articulosus TaxID=60185 RepID=A0AAD5K9T4_9FUNG|nr:hypothetical protein BDA99DRAFT_539016 [Phascolomyces articulosus]